MANFTKLAATAKRLIRANGRTMQLVKKSNTPKDPDKPWRETDCADEDLTVFGAVVLDTTTLLPGTLVPIQELVAWIEPISGIDLTEYDLIRDNGKLYPLGSKLAIKPATTILCYRMVIDR